jgi:hypothetical protein
MNCDIRVRLDADRGEGAFSSEDGCETYSFWQIIDLSLLRWAP